MKILFSLTLLIASPLYAWHSFPELETYQNKLNASNCVTSTQTATKYLYDLENSGLKPIGPKAHASLLEDLWKVKEGLHEKMKTITLTPTCVHEIREFQIALRHIEDVVEEDFYHRNKKSQVFNEHSFHALDPHTKRHSKFEKFNMAKDLKSGDMILSRGKVYTSAAISALGNYNTQFSHISMVYKDPKGKLWTIESHIEVGAFVRPLQDHINDNNFRTMIYRFHDEKLAAKAAEFIFKKVKRASDTVGNINYDFAFDPHNSQELFCSEIASHAFDEVSYGMVRIPKFSSPITAKKPLLLKQLGITIKESFIPADIEVDPRFQMIAEWKNAALITDILEKDAVLQSMFKWAEEKDYVFNQASSGTSLIYRNIAWPLRRVPLLDRYFVEKLPLNMSRELIGFFGVLESTGELLQKQLQSSKHILTKREKFIILEYYRKKDKALGGKLHRMFAPKR